jgi:branched-chain amino acid transport system ATP-binding protein
LSLLRVNNLTKKFEGLCAVNDVSFEVKENEIVSLIGPNGAGKTTTFSMLSGIEPPTSGQIVFDGNDIVNTPPFRIARMGMVTTFQKVKVFPNITVIEAAMIGSHVLTETNYFDIITRNKRFYNEEKRLKDICEEKLEYFGLSKRKNWLCKNLSHGEQRVLGIAIAMVSKPKMILLDEPVAGLNPQESKWMMSLIDGLRKSGTTILLIEHDMGMVMAISDRIIVLNFGNKIAEGTASEISRNDKVIEAYLGERDVEKC